MWLSKPTTLVYIKWRNVEFTPSQRKCTWGTLLFMVYGIEPRLHLQRSMIRYWTVPNGDQSVVRCAKLVTNLNNLNVEHSAKSDYIRKNWFKKKFYTVTSCPHRMPLWPPLNTVPCHFTNMHHQKSRGRQVGSCWLGMNPV